MYSVVLGFIVLQTAYHVRFLLLFTAVHTATLGPQRFDGTQRRFSATLLSASSTQELVTLATAQDADVMIDESYMRDAMDADRFCTANNTNANVQA